MGWSIHLQANKPIDPSDIDWAIAQSPPTLQGFASRQAWGWSTAVDIWNPKDHELRLSGSFSQSGQIAELAAQTIARFLEQRGYTITVRDLTG